MALRKLPAVVLVLVSIPFAACGGDAGMSADDYRAELDAACERLQERNSTIPQTIRDEQLRIEDAQELATRYGEEFKARVDALEPPEDLADAHQRLLDVGDEPPPSGDDAEAVAAWMRGIADVYEELGADGCERSQRAGAVQIEQSAP